jgi:nicotinamide mononucleotide transporter
VSQRRPSVSGATPDNSYAPFDTMRASRRTAIGWSYVLIALEPVANVVMAISIWLAARNSVHTWSTGIAGCALFCLVFARNQLYADATLQLFFIATSLIGWWHWRHPAVPVQSNERRITKAKPRTLAWMTVAAIIVTLTYGSLLYRFTNAYLPYVDSCVLALSVIAQCLLMQRKMETWPFWLAVNTISVALFFSRGLVVTAALYSAYWANAWYGWWRWRKEFSSPPTSVELTT